MSEDKRCSRCRETKDVSEFYTAGFRWGKKLFARWCKACRRKDECKRRKRPDVISRRKNSLENDLSFRANEMVCAARKRANRGKLKFNLDKEWALERLMVGKCELTGLNFDLTIRNRRPGLMTPSIDRIKPSRGYTKANCRVVLHSLNVALNNWGSEKFLPVAKAFIERSSEKK